MIERPDIRVSSWGELCEKLYVDSYQKDIGRFRSNFAFRGLFDAAHMLSTSLMRLGGVYRQMEYHLMRNFRKYARHENLTPQSSDWHWWMVGQHHGLPTRLLDWTYSPFIALHFATVHTKLFDRDAAVWCLDYVKLHKLLPGRLKGILTEVGANVFTVEMLERVAKNFADFDTLHPHTFNVFFEPPSLDARIVNQYALFSVLSSPTLALGDWLAPHPELYHRIIIPKELKLEVRDKLDQSNITERVLFPGLDGLAAWLKRHYSPL